MMLVHHPLRQVDLLVSELSQFGFPPGGECATRMGVRFYEMVMNNVLAGDFRSVASAQTSASSNSAAWVV